MGKTPSSFTLLTNAENTAVPAELKSLSTGACASANKALSLKVETVPQATLDQRLQLLAGQNALPATFAAGSAPDTTKALVKAGDVVDFSKALTDLGVADKIAPAAVSTIKALYGGLTVLPYEFNIEGIWYNKKIFAANGLTVPTTWDQLLAAAAKLKAAGITPFSASGQQGWPITRLIGNYLFRDLGPDAMTKVQSGQAKLTDPDYVKAAQAVADLGKSGYFGKGVGSIDYATSVNQFMAGKAGMLYMGSWVLSNFADKTLDKIGTDNIGFMPFPAVTGGKGSIDAYPANVGLPYTFDAKTYDGPTGKVGAWLKCIATNWGSSDLKDAGALSGFVQSTPVTGAPALTTLVQNTISSSKSSVLWFEALFGTKATTDSTASAAPLVTGSMSAADFMKKVQADLSAK